MNSNKPLVSVIMGTYNSEKVLSRGIESILNQTYTHIEFVICDDGSADNTLTILKQYASEDNRIVVLQNEQNSGLSTALNRCVEAAKGTFIARMDDDDISHPDRIEKQLDYMLKFPEYVIAGTGANIFDENGIWGQRSFCGERGKNDIYLGKTFIHPSVMMRKDALNAVGNYTVSPSVMRTEDYDLWCKFYYNGYKGANMPDFLLDYCESATSVKRRKYRYRLVNFKLMLHWRKKLSLPVHYSLYAFKPLIAGLIPRQILLNVKMRNIDRKKINTAPMNETNC